MTPEVRAIIEQELRGDEGEVLRVYDDATGKPFGPGMTCHGNPTIGIGRDLWSRGISSEEAELLLSNDLAACERELAPLLPWLTELSANRLAVIYSLYFNTGLGNPHHFVAGWPKFLALMQKAQFAEASDDLEHSQPWATQVGARAMRLAKLVRNG